MKKKQDSQNNNNETIGEQREPKKIPFILTNTQFKRHRIFNLVLSIIRWFIIALLAVYICVTVYTYYIEKSTGDNMSMPFGFAFSIVISGSMEPEINIDDAIFVVKTKDVSVGDIIVFDYPLNGQEVLVVHRIRSIVYVDKDGLETNLERTPNLDGFNKNSKGEIVNKQGETIKLITQGDSNTAHDNPINISKVKGKYVFRIKKLGNLIELMKTRTGIIVMVLIAVILVLITILLDYLLIIRNEKELRKQIEILNEQSQIFDKRKE